MYVGYISSTHHTVLHEVAIIIIILVTMIITIVIKIIIIISLAGRRFVQDIFARCSQRPADATINSGALFEVSYYLEL